MRKKDMGSHKLEDTTKENAEEGNEEVVSKVDGIVNALSQLVIAEKELLQHGDNALPKVQTADLQASHGESSETKGLVTVLEAGEDVEKHKELKEVDKQKDVDRPKEQTEHRPRNKGAIPKLSQSTKSEVNTSIQSSFRKSNSSRFTTSLSTTDTTIDSLKKNSAIHESKEAPSLGDLCGGDADPNEQLWSSSANAERCVPKKKTRFACEVDVLYFMDREVTRGTEPLADEVDQQARSYKKRFKSPVDQVTFQKFYDPWQNL